MNKALIKQFCLEQCNDYHNYVKKFTQHHGKTAIEINSLKRLDKTLFEIKLDKAILNFDTTYFKNSISDEYYFNKKDLLIKEYDNKNKLLYIQFINKDIDLKSLQASEFFIINDLLFLIKNLIEWYENYGDKLKYSNNKPQIQNYCLNNLFDTKLNENQKEAVKTIFESAYSYIWGPPGTGKTKAVLSSSIINYINHGKKVLIVAPTNVALEQILYGVIENTQKLNISKDKFLRVGVPSKKFLEEHSSICEIRGIENQIQEIENELNIINKVIKYREGKEISFDLENINHLLEEIINYKHKIKKLEEKKEHLQPLVNLLTQPLKKYHFSNNARMIKDAIYKRSEHESVNYDEKLIEKNRLKEVVNMKLLREDIKTYDDKISAISKKILQILKKAKSFTKSKKIYNEIFKDLDNTNLHERKNLLLKKIDALNSWAIKWKESLKELLKSNKDELIKQALNEHHKNFDIQKLIERKEDIEEKRDFLLEQTTKIRVENSQIIAMTIDGYIQYTLCSDLNVQHIFCDEAGYMSNIKALTLFKNNCPITFLGDHMQLPPVSEVNNDDLKYMQKTFLWSQPSIFFESIFIEDNKTVLFEQYLKSPTPSYKNVKQANLNYTHRFGNNLAQVLDKYVYKFGFKSASQKETQIISINSNSNPKEAYERNSFEEANIIKLFLEKNKLKDFAILTPYKKQVELLKKTLGKEYYENIMTIHKSQGSEWNTVIFSVVDDSKEKSSKRRAFFTDSSNDKFNSLNLINTVVSRSKKRLVIVANEEFWTKGIKNQLIGDLIGVSK